MDSTKQASSTQSQNAKTTSSSTSTNIDFDNRFFESELFKITLTDPHESHPIAITQDIPGSNSGPKEPAASDIEHDCGTVFYVHKRLLMSLSPEWAKHTDNRMKEGLLGEMNLGGVDTSTMQWFLQWAYRGECKLYVFRWCLLPCFQV